MLDTSIFVDFNKIENVRTSIFTKRRYVLQKFVKWGTGISHPVKPSIEYPLLNQLAREGNMDEIKLLLKTPFSKNIQERTWWKEINKQDYLKRTALHEASEKGNLNIIIELIENGADPNLIDGKAQTCLHYAARYNHEKIALYLLHTMDKETINAIDLSGNSALLEALLHKNYNIVLLLLYFNMNFNITNNIGLNALKLAKDSQFFEFSNFCESEEKIEYFLNLISNSLNIKDFFAKMYQLNVNLTQNEFIANFLSCSIVKQTYLHQWIETNQFNKIKIILNKFQFSQEILLHFMLKQDKNGQTIIHYLAKQGNINRFKYLTNFLHNKNELEKIISKLDNLHQTPIFICAKYNHWEMFEYLCEFISKETFKKTYFNIKNESIVRFLIYSAPTQYFLIISKFLGNEVLKTQHFTILNKKNEKIDICISGLICLCIIFNRKDILNECDLNLDNLNHSIEGFDQSTRERPLLSLALDLERWEILNYLLSSSNEINLIQKDKKQIDFIDRCFLNKKNPKLIEILPKILENRNLNNYLQLKRLKNKILFSFFIGGFEFTFNYFTENEIKSIYYSQHFLFLILKNEFECNINFQINKSIENFISFIFSQSEDDQNDNNHFSIDYSLKKENNLRKIYFSNLLEDRTCLNKQIYSKYIFIDDKLFFMQDKEEKNIFLLISKKINFHNKNLMRKILNVLIPFGNSILLAQCFTGFLQLLFWDECKLIFNKIHSSYWLSSKQSKDNLLFSIKICISYDQIGFLIQLLPFLKEMIINDKNQNNKNDNDYLYDDNYIKNQIPIEFLRDSMRFGSYKCFTWILVNFPSIIKKSETYTQGIKFGKSLTSYQLQNHKFQSFNSPYEIPFQNEQIIKQAINIWERPNWQFQYSYFKGYNFAQMCVYRGFDELILLSLSLFDNNEEKQKFILNFYLIPLCLQGKNFILTEKILDHIQSSIDFIPSYEKYENGKAFKYLFRYIKSSSLLSSLIHKGFLNLTDKKEFLITLKYESRYYSSNPNEYFEFYLKEILQLIKDNNTLKQILSEEFLISLLSQSSFYYYSNFENLLIWLFSNYKFLFDFKNEILSNFSKFFKFGYWNLFHLFFNENYFSFLDFTDIEWFDYIDCSLFYCSLQSFTILSNFINHCPNSHLYINKINSLSINDISLYRASRNIEICKLILSNHFILPEKLLLCPLIYYNLDLNIFREILKFQQQINPITEINYPKTKITTFIHILSSFASKEIFREILQILNNPWNIKNSKNETILMSAAKYKNFSILNEISRNVDKNGWEKLIRQTDILGNNCLHFACFSGDVFCIQLLANDYLIESKNNRGNNALFDAFILGNCEALHFLRKNYKNATIITKNQKIYKYYFDLHCGWFHQLMMLNELNSDSYNEKNDFYPLEFSLNYVKARIMSNVSPIVFFSYAIRKNQLEIVQYLLKEEENEILTFIINNSTSLENPLIYSACFSHLEITKTLLQFYQNNSLTAPLITQPYVSGDTLLHFACKNSWENFAFELVNSFSFSWTRENKVILF